MRRGSYYLTSGKLKGRRNGLRTMKKERRKRSKESKRTAQHMMAMEMTMRETLMT